MATKRSIFADGGLEMKEANPASTLAEAVLLIEGFDVVGHTQQSEDEKLDCLNEMKRNEGKVYVSVVPIGNKNISPPWQI